MSKKAINTQTKSFQFKMKQTHSSAFVCYMCCDSFTISNDNKQDIYISFTLHLHLFNTLLCLQVWTKLLFIPDGGECQLLTFIRVSIKRNKIILSKNSSSLPDPSLSLFRWTSRTLVQNNKKMLNIDVFDTVGCNTQTKKKCLCDSTSKYRVDPKPQNTLCCLEEGHTNYPDSTSLSVRRNITIEPDH